MRAFAALPGAGRLGRRPRAGHAAVRPRRGRARLDADRGGPPRRARPRRAERRARAAARAGSTARSDASLARDRERLDRDRDRLRAAPLLLLERRRAALDHAAARLQALSPRATLARGYAIVRSSGSALKRRRRGRARQPLEIELATGGLDRDGRGGAAVTDGDAGERDVRGAPARARGDRRQARARRRRGRRGDPALAARRGAPPALRGAARGGRGHGSRSSPRAADDSGAPGL